jgi:hypothetical protein
MSFETAREAVANSRQRGDTERPDFGFSLTILGGFLTDKGNSEADTCLRDGGAISENYCNRPLVGGRFCATSRSPFYRQEIH